MPDKITAHDLSAKFQAVRKAGSGFIPESAVFVLNPGKTADRAGKNAWMLVENFQGRDDLHQSPDFWKLSKRSRRQAYESLTEILSAYRK